MKHTHGRLLVVGLTAISLTAYASSSGVFTDYRESFHQAKAAFTPGNYSGAEKVFGSDMKKEDGAALLANLELAGLYQAGGDFAKSRECLLKVDRISREMEDRVKISGRNVLRTAASTVTSDRAIEFTGESFEKVMARSLNALNFLMLGDLEGAGVEVRKAEIYQKQERERHERELLAMEQEAAQETKEQKDARAAGEQAYATSSELATELKKIAAYTKGFENSYQNPFTHVLSGLIYELGGDKHDQDSASLEYKRAYELWPTSMAIKELRSSAKDGNAMSKDSSLGRIVVLYGAGFIAEKQEIKFSVSVPPKGTPAWVAFATYGDYTPLSERLVIRSGSKKATSDPVVNLRVFAVRTLQDKWKATAIRQAARVIVKTAASEAAKADEEEDAKKKEQGGFLGKLKKVAGGRAGEVYNAVSEGADLRAWYSLPDQLQAAVLYLPIGEQQVELSRTTSPAVSKSIPVTVKAGETTVVYARGFDNYLGAFAASRAMGVAGREMTAPSATANAATPDGEAAAPPTAPRSTTIASAAPRPPGASSPQVGSRDDVEIVRRKAERLDSGFLSGFLVVQVTIRGNRREITRYESMFEWFDAAGRKIDDASAWTPGRIDGGADQDLQAVAPRTAAASCRFHIRSPTSNAPERELSSVSSLNP